MRARLRRTILATVTCGALAAIALASPRATASPTSVESADELVRQAREHEPDDELLALRRYSEALAIDPTNHDAYLGLGALRFRRGDLREAERVYDAALTRLPELTAALQGRAEARWGLGLRSAAEEDLERLSRATDDPRVLRELADWYATDARPLSQLATWRRILSVAEAKGDTEQTTHARAMVRALQIVVSGADPVTAPVAGDSVRRGIARVARRGG